MMETFATFDGLLKAFWIIAGASSLVFIIQTILTFIGLGTDSDFDTGVEGLDDLKARITHVLKFSSTISYALKRNPRLIKRFLNAFDIRRELLRINGLNNDNNEFALLKLMLIEQQYNERFKELYNLISSSKNYTEQLLDL